MKVIALIAVALIWQVAANFEDKDRAALARLVTQLRLQKPVPRAVLAEGGVVRAFLRDKRQVSSFADLEKALKGCPAATLHGGESYRHDGTTEFSTKFACPGGAIYLTAMLKSAKIQELIWSDHIVIFAPPLPGSKTDG